MAQIPGKIAITAELLLIPGAGVGVNRNDTPLKTAAGLLQSAEKYSLTIKAYATPKTLGVDQIITEMIGR